MFFYAIDTQNIKNFTLKSTPQAKPNNINYISQTATYCFHQHCDYGSLLQLAIAFTYGQSYRVLIILIFH